MTIFIDTTMSKRITKGEKALLELKGNRLKGLCVNLAWKLEEVHPTPQVIE